MQCLRHVQHPILQILTPLAVIFSVVGSSIRVAYFNFTRIGTTSRDFRRVIPTVEVERL